MLSVCGSGSVRRKVKEIASTWWKTRSPDGDAHRNGEDAVADGSTNYPAPFPVIKP